MLLLYAASLSPERLAAFQQISHAQNEVHSTGRGVTVPQERAALSGKSYALIVGISEYKYDPIVPSLRFADKDAETFTELLISPRGGRLKKPEELTLLTNQCATRAAIDFAVRKLSAEHASRNNTLILFVAAHGVYLKTDVVNGRVIERDPYILTHESNPQDTKVTGYPMGEFRKMVAEQAHAFGRVLVFVDVCHAGNASMGGVNDLDPAVRDIFEGGAGELGILLATHARKVAYESPNIGGGHGAFSYYVISGLNGLAAPDKETITFSDIKDYVSRQVYWLTRNTQQPDGQATSEDMVLVANAKLSGVELAPPPKEQLSESEIHDLRRNRALPLGVRSGAPAAAPGDVFDQALQRGSLLPEDPASAANLLAQMRQNTADPAQIKDREQRLYVALDDRGQEIMSRYLDGEQNAPTKEEFALCARYFQEALRLEPDSIFDQSRALFCQGRAAIFDKQYDKAKDLLDHSISLDSKRAYAYNALGIALLEQSAGNAPVLDAAADEFRMAMRFAPYWAYPIHNLALLESERGNYDQAIRLYRDAMQKAPRFSYLPYSLGLLYERLQDLDNAMQWFTEARKVAEKYRSPSGGSWPERSQIWNAMGTVARDQQREQKSLGFFQKAVDDDSKNPNARHNLALVLAKRAEYSRADELWARNMTLEPKYMPSWIAYAESLTERGEAKRAIEVYEKIIADKKDYVGARLVIARLYQDAGQCNKAIEHLAAALELSPKNTELLELRGDCYAQLHSVDAARRDWSDALRLATARTVRSRLHKKLNNLPGKADSASSR